MVPNSRNTTGKQMRQTRSHLATIWFFRCILAWATCGGTWLDAAGLGSGGGRGSGKAVGMLRRRLPVFFSFMHPQPPIPNSFTHSPPKSMDLKSLMPKTWQNLKLSESCESCRNDGEIMYFLGHLYWQKCLKNRAFASCKKWTDFSLNIRFFI